MPCACSEAVLTVYSTCLPVAESIYLSSYTRSPVPSTLCSRRINDDKMQIENQPFAAYSHSTECGKVLPVRLCRVGRKRGERRMHKKGGELPILPTSCKQTYAHARTHARTPPVWGRGNNRQAGTLFLCIFLFLTTNLSTKLHQPLPKPQELKGVEGVRFLFCNLVIGTSETW